MRQKRYDIVHTHNSKAGFIGRLAAKIAGVPIIIHTIHGFAFHEYERPPRRILFILLERFAARLCDKLITISEPLKEWGLRLKIGRPEKYVTIYSGIEVEKFKVNINIDGKKKELGIKPNVKVIGVVAKLWEGKGHETVLEAAPQVIKKIPDVKFLFVGEGYLRDRLKARVRKLGLSDKIIFTGFRSDIPKITATFDVALLVSLFEGMGRVLLEAMVLGKPVVATKVGGIVDVVKASGLEGPLAWKEGETGILVPPGDADALAKAIVTILKDEELARRMGEAGKRRIDKRFTAKTMVKRISEVYEKLIESTDEHRWKNADEHR
ncbi:putative glycosyltransferase EpsD [subsurface metagenome]